MANRELAEVLFPAPRPRSRRRVDGDNTPAPTLEMEGHGLQRHGDEFTFTWPRHGVAVGVTRLREASDGVHAEITVETSTGGSHWGRLNLSSHSGRETLAKTLRDMQSEVDWRRLLNGVCQQVTEEYRKGDPVRVLLPVAATGAQYLIEKLLPLDATSVLFGDGGQGKSWLALTLAVVLATGKGLPCGLRPTRTCPTLYLDWEGNEADSANRLRAILAGMEVENYSGEIHYRRMTRGLTEDATLLRSEIARRGVGLVVVDSLGAACGAEPEGADAAVRTMNTLRSFSPATNLVVAHVSKAAADQRGASRPYGSVYVANLARSVWEVRRADDEDTLTVGFFHRKTNRGKLAPPFGLSLIFEGPEDSPLAVRVKPQDIATSRTLLEKTSLSVRLQKLLKSGAMTTEQLAEETETSEAQVRTYLSRLQKGGKVIPLPSADGEKRKRWALPYQGSAT